MESPMKKNVAPRARCCLSDTMSLKKETIPPQTKQTPDNKQKRTGFLFIGKNGFLRENGSDQSIALRYPLLAISHKNKPIPVTDETIAHAIQSTFEFSGENDERLHVTPTTTRIRSISHM